MFELLRMPRGRQRRRVIAALGAALGLLCLAGLAVFGQAHNSPGITGREVAATTTRHTSDTRGDHTTKFSVMMRLNLEGPPTRDTWGFVTAVTYTAIPLTTP